MLIELKLKTHSSFRGLAKQLLILNVYFSLFKKVPCHVTISNWIKKVGYYEINRGKEKSNDWIIIIDESIQIGAEKLLVILGINSINIDFIHPLNFKDIRPILQVNKKGWNAQKVMHEIEKAKKILGNIKYAVSDNGASLTKGLELSSIPRVYDITHCVANILKRNYKDDPDFISYLKKTVTLRSQLQQTKWAYLIPPQQRSQSRFQNLKPIIQWGIKTLYYLNNNAKGDVFHDENRELLKKAGWLNDFRFFLEELSQILHTVEQIFKIVKKEGINKETVKRCEIHINQLKGIKGRTIGKEINQYFTEVLNMGIKNVVCTSDIIESAFGMYKNNISPNSLAGITNLSLIIPAYTSNITGKSIKQIMESITSEDVKKWSQEYIGDSILKKRKNAYNHKKTINGTNKNHKKVA